MIITFIALIVPFLVLIRPLQKNNFFILYFALMCLSSYITENCYFRVKMFSHKAFLLFIVYHLICINLVVFLAYGTDKRAAQRGNWRVPEAQLHTLEFLGGWIGAFIAQRLFHHKTKKRSYRIMFWLMLFLQGFSVYIILSYLGLIS